MISSFATKTSRLAAVYRTLARDAIQIYRWKLVTPLAAALIGIVLQVGTIGVMFYYINHVIQGTPLAVASLTFSARDSLELLGLVSLVCLLLLLVSAGATYFYHARAVAMSCGIERHYIGRIFRWTADNERLRVPSVGATEQSSLLRILMNDPRCAGRSFLLVYSSIIPLVTFVAAAATLFMLHPPLTLLLLAILAVFCVAHVRVTQFGVESSRNFETFGARTRDTFRNALSLIKENTITAGPGDKWFAGEQEELSRYLSSYGGLIGLPYRSSLISDLFLALTLAVVFLGLSAAALANDFPWATITGYLVALQYGMRNLKHTLYRVTAANRFFPQTSRLLSLAPQEDAIVAGTELPPSFVVQTPATSGLLPNETTLSRGVPAFIYLSSGLNRFNAREILKTLGGQESDVRHTICSSLLHHQMNSSVRLQNYLAGSPVAELVRQQLADRAGAVYAVSQLCEDREALAVLTDLPGAPARSESPQIMARASLYFCIMASVVTAAPWVFLAAADLELLSPSEVRQFLSVWRDRFILFYRRELIVPRSPNVEYSPEAAVVVLATPFQVLWAGPSREFSRRRKDLIPRFKNVGVKGAPLESHEPDLDLAEV